MIEIKNRYSDAIIRVVEHLNGVDLSYTDLRNANLRNADLSGANLRNANLRNADLSYANLRNADLNGVDLSYANLRNADLNGVDLSYANLNGVDLSGANLRNANLRNVVGNFREVRSLQFEKYQIAYTTEVIQIGCRQYTIDRWKSFSDETISCMDRGALEWWHKWKDILFKIIELSTIVPPEGDRD